MKLPPQITFRNMSASGAMEQEIRDRCAKLDAFYDGIMGCRIMVEAQHHHHHQGRIYHVRIDLTVPGHELVVSRDPGKDPAHEDVYVAVRDAFDAARRQLEDWVRRQRPATRIHGAAIPAHGRIARLHPEENHGIIETPEGREIYFHRHSVVNADFDELEIGAPVRFHEEAGDEGPQASSVLVEGKHHLAG